MRTLIKYLIFTACIQHVNAQNDVPIWDVGTKWTYEFNRILDINDTLDFAIVQVVDTITIDSLLLYKLERKHSTCEQISYLHYQDQRVYNYDTSTKNLQLLYDFGNDKDYETNYIPQFCFGIGPDTRSVTMKILVDSISLFQMSDGSYRKMKYVKAIDDFTIDKVTNFHHVIILEGIGFMDGTGAYTHAWFIEEEFCDQLSCFPKYLRCFENDSIKFNFVNFPCDSSFRTSVHHEQSFNVNLFPNPTFDKLTVKTNSSNLRYKLYNSSGILIDKGIVHDQDEIHVENAGLYFLKLFNDEYSKIEQVIKLD